MTSWDVTFVIGPPWPGCTFGIGGVMILFFISLDFDGAGELKICGGQRCCRILYV